jgi:hypothetical protein
MRLFHYIEGHPETIPKNEEDRSNEKNINGKVK